MHPSVPSYTPSYIYADQPALYFPCDILNTKTEYFNWVSSRGSVGQIGRNLVLNDKVWSQSAVKAVPCGLLSQSSLLPPRRLTTLVTPVALPFFFSSSFRYLSCLS
jgi:hypothetical protein